MKSSTQLLDKTIRYAKRLVAFESVSVLSNKSITAYLFSKLSKYGFIVEQLRYRDRNKVRKYCLVAKKGTGVGGLAYFAHSDTVPADHWFTQKFGPFEATIGRQRLYGRGSCDMKGSIACMLVAAQQIKSSEMHRPFYFVVTADEEVGFHGARHVARKSRFYQEMIENDTLAIIGEPTSMQVVHAHKGSCLIEAQSRGKAAHSSTNRGVNANLPMIEFLQELKTIHQQVEEQPEWHNYEFDPPTLSWNIGINDGNHAINVTAPRSRATVYFRPMPNVNTKPIIERVELAAQRLNIRLKVRRYAEPLYTDPQSHFLQQTLQLLEQDTAKTVSYGTDGGVLTELKNRIVLGPGNIEQAHTANEWIALDQLKRATKIYLKLIRHWCCEPASEPSPVTTDK